jgi:hypothetical protein
MSLTFYKVTSVILLLGVIAFAYVIYQESHALVIQSRLITDMWQYIVQGCPTGQ